MISILKILTGIFLLGFLVFIHELGHFIVARLCGVKVEAFSLGMGPVLFHKEIKNTDWRISLLPFGGYCAMKGEKDFEESYNENIILENDSFYGIRPIFRAMIGFAGPLANLLFSILAFFIIALTGYTYYTFGTTIKIATEVYPELHSSAAEAGLLTGDKILKINNTLINDFNQLHEEVAIHPDEYLTIVVDRNGKELTFSVHSEINKSSGEGKIGVVAEESSRIKKEAVRYSFFPALGQGFYRTFRSIHLAIKGIGILFKGVDIKKNVAGPARITSMLGENASVGFSNGIRNGLAAILEFMAIICVSLFIMNLLPIPILDGFLVITSLIEAIFHIRVSPNVRNIVQYIGLTLIAFLFIIAISSDFNYFYDLIKGK